MITVTVEKRYGASGAMTIRFSSSAASVREAVDRYGPDAKLVVPVEPEGFFATEEPWRSVTGLESTRPAEGVTA